MKYLFFFILIFSFNVYSNCIEIAKKMQNKNYKLIASQSFNPKYFFSDKKIKCEVIIYNKRYSFVRSFCDIRIKKVRISKHNIVFEFDSEILYNGRIDLSFNQNISKISKKFFNKIIKSIFIIKENNVIKCVVNPETKIIHNIYCNHLPEKKIYFNSLEEALKKGYKKCKFCYPEIPILNDLDIESALSKEVQAEVRYYYPISNNKNNNEKLKRIGKKILLNWPFILRGYKYRFYVLNSDEMQALSCPGGYIYISDSLLNAFETDQECEAVLAHEITHCELRHGYYSFKKVMDQLNSDTIFSVLLSTTVDSDALLKIYRAISDYAKMFVLSGYSREYEKQADIFSALYMTKNYNNCKGLKSILNKLKYLNTAYESNNDNKFSTHPSLNKRIENIENFKFKFFSKKIKFNGFSSKNKILANFLIYGIGVYENKTILVANLKTKDNFKKIYGIRQGKSVLLNNKKSYFLNNIYLVSGSIAPVIIKIDKDISDISDIDLKIPQIIKWKRAN